MICLHTIWKYCWSAVFFLEAYEDDLSPLVGICLALFQEFGGITYLFLKKEKKVYLEKLIPLQRFQSILDSSELGCVSKINVPA